MQTWVLASELDGRVTHMRDAFAVLLITEVHAVRVSIAAPSHGNTQAVHSALELICVATAGRPRGCRGRQKKTRNYNAALRIHIQKAQIQILLLTVMTARLPDVKNQFPGMEAVTSVRHNHNELWIKENFLMNSGPGLALWRPSLGIGHKGFPSWQRLASGRIWRGGSGKPDLVCKQREVCPRTGICWGELTRITSYCTLTLEIWL